LCGEDVGVAVGEDGEVVPFYVHEGKDDVFPAVDAEEFEVFLEAVCVDRIGSVDYGQDDVVEESLEGWDGHAMSEEEGGEGVCCCNAEGENLPIVVSFLP
jgi:hypothetical protein